VPERSGDGGYRGLVLKGSGAVREVAGVRRKAALAVVKPKGMEGERPREDKPRRARVPWKLRNR
jgi:hypothetical protein